MSTFLVTGSNRGIGLEITKQLDLQGHDVIATCRKTSKGLDALNVRIIEDVDISSSLSINNLKNILKGTNINCLINNAGIAEYNNLNDLDSESIKKQFLINALSPLCFTKELIEFLNINSKIAFITSRMASIEDNSSGSSYGYRMSKVALSMAAKSLSIDLLDKNIFVAIIHPGLVSTRMTGFTKKGISTKESALGILKRIESLGCDNTGTFWHSNGEILPW